MSITFLPESATLRTSPDVTTGRCIKRKGHTGPLRCKLTPATTFLKGLNPSFTAPVFLNLLNSVLRGVIDRRC